MNLAAIYHINPRQGAGGRLEYVDLLMSEGAGDLFAFLHITAASVPSLALGSGSFSPEIILRGSGEAASAT